MNTLILSDIFYILFLLSGIGLLIYRTVHFDEDSVSNFVQVFLLTGLFSFIYFEFRPILASVDWLGIANFIDPTKAITIFIFVMASSFLLIRKGVASIFFIIERGAITLTLMIVPIWLIINIDNVWLYVVTSFISIIILWRYFSIIKGKEKVESDEMINRYYDCINELEYRKSQNK